MPLNRERDMQQLQARAQAGDANAKRMLAQQGVNQFSVSTPATRGDTARQEQDDLAFQQANENLARTMNRGGRGLTDGAASRRGQAGRPTQVPPGAVYEAPRAMGRTYWDQATGGGSNEVELAGMMNRGAQQLAGGDQAGKDLFLKGFNDGPWSSRTDADDIQIDKDGGVVLYAGGKPLNKTPIPMEELQNITGSQLTGQTAFQRAPGGAMQGQGLGPAQSKSAVKAAEMVGGADIKMMGDQVKALEKQLDITSDADRPALEARIAQAKQQQRDAIQQGGQSVYGAGLPTDGGQRAANPAQEMQQLVDSDKSDNEIKQIMWDKYGSDAVMRGVNNELKRRGGEPAGLTEPTPDKDVPVGPTGQPGLKLGTAPAVKAPAKTTDGFQQKYEAETKAAQEKEAKTKAKGETFKKVRRLYDVMQTTKNLKPKDVEYLQSVYDDPNASAKVKKEAYTAYKKYRDLNP